MSETQRLIASVAVLEYGSVAVRDLLPGRQHDVELRISNAGGPLVSASGPASGPLLLPGSFPQATSAMTMRASVLRMRNPLESWRAYQSGCRCKIIIEHEFCFTVTGVMLLCGTARKVRSRACIRRGSVRDRWWFRWRSRGARRRRARRAGPRSPRPAGGRNLRHPRLRAEEAARVTPAKSAGCSIDARGYGWTFGAGRSIGPRLSPPRTRRSHGCRPATPSDCARREYGCSKGAHT